MIVTSRQLNNKILSMALGARRLLTASSPRHSKAYIQTQANVNLCDRVQHWAHQRFSKPRAGDGPMDRRINLIF